MARATGQDPATVPGEQSSLNTNALGLWGLVIMGIAYMGLALTAYFNFGIMEGITGPMVPLAFAAVTVAMLPTAASYAIMNSRRPSTGATLTWLWEATTPPLGVWLGWVLVIAYIVGCILQPVMFGLFFNSFLNYFGVHTGYMSATLAGLIPILVVGYMTKKDIRISARIVGLFITDRGRLRRAAVPVHPDQAGRRREPDLAAVQPHRRHGGWTGFLNALLFAVLAIAAFDIVAPMAEETRTPRSLVPRATIYVTVGAGLYWVFTSFGIVNAVPAATMASYVTSGQFTPDLPGRRALRELAQDPGPADRLHRRVRRVQRDLAGRQPPALRAQPRGPGAAGVRADRPQQDAVERPAAGPGVLRGPADPDQPVPAAQPAAGVRLDRRGVRVLHPDPVHPHLRGQHLLPPALPPQRVQPADQPGAAGARHRASTSTSSTRTSSRRSC